MEIKLLTDHIYECKRKVEVKTENKFNLRRHLQKHKNSTINLDKMPPKARLWLVRIKS